MLRLKNLLFLTLAAALGATVSRVCYLFFTVTESTGFLDQRMRLTGLLLIGFSLLCALICAAFGFFVKDTFAHRQRPSLLLGLASVATAVALAVALFNTPGSLPTTGWQFWFKQLFGLAACVTFLVYGLSSFLSFRVPNLLFVFVLLYLIFQTIAVFTSYATLALIGEHLFDLLQMCVLMLFFLGLGKFISSPDKNRPLPYLIPTGLASFVLCLSGFFTRLVVRLSGHGGVLHGEYPLMTADLFLGLFILLWIADHLLPNKQSAAQTTDE